MACHFRNFVFEGGGVKGIAYIGALDVLADRGIISGIERIGGTSAGAINAHIVGGGVRSSLKGGGEEESWTDGFLLIGGGVNVMPNARVGIRLGADYVRAFTEDEGLNVFRFAAGIVLPFGSR